MWNVNRRPRAIMALGSNGNMVLRCAAIIAATIAIAGCEGPAVGPDHDPGFIARDSWPGTELDDMSGDTSEIGARLDVGNGDHRFEETEVVVELDSGLPEIGADAGTFDLTIDDSKQRDIGLDSSELVCQPDCAGRTCGEDGCEGSCGTCGLSQSCDNRGQCVCQPEVGECEGTCCPVMPGYLSSCNVKGLCEFTNIDPTGWKRWDVWIYVPAGSFFMGSPETEDGHRYSESPYHEVTFANGYLIGKYEVTVEQYDACAKQSPESCTPGSVSHFDGYGWGLNGTANGRHEHPQNGIDWDQAKAVCAWLEGRLPSEAEWEYAAKGPVHRKYPWGDNPEPTCSYGVYDHDGVKGRPFACDPCTTAGCSGTWPVGSKPLGVAWSGALDMAGNVMEWCEDRFTSNYDETPRDGSPWMEETLDFARVSRGAGFFYKASALRSASRGGLGLASAHADVGARCVRNLAQ